MSTARFGPAGNSESFSRLYKSTAQAPPWLESLGLNAFEYQCGRGVNLGDETARTLGEVFSAYDIALSLHSPYYINLAAEDEERRGKNLGYLMQSVRAASLMGATRIVVHTGAAGGGLDRAHALKTALSMLRLALSKMEESGFGHITLCPETMGKVNQLGTFSEVMALCAADERLLPCVDFGHVYARSHGLVDGHEAFAALLDEMERELGFDRVRSFHIHFSRIAYSPGGEVRHLTLADPSFGPDFRPLAGLLRSKGYTPRVICESAGTQAEDAQTLRDMFFSAIH